MTHKVLPSKLVDERITVRLEFMDLLDWGELISSVETTVFVGSGLDDNPEELKYTPPGFAGTVVTQVLHAGLPGVIYTLGVVVTGTLGNVVEKQVKVAVLPSVAGTPPFIAEYFTSRPYPLNVVETFTTQAIAGDGAFFNLLSDSFNTAISFTGGSLRTILIDVSQASEAIQTGIAITSGTIEVPLIEIDQGFESFQASVVIDSGTLKIIVISYTNYPPENFQTGINIDGGTLV